MTTVYKEMTMSQHHESRERVEFSVVIPVYNSSKTLADLVKRIDKVFRELARSYEIVLTDDASRDNVWRNIESLHSEGYPIQAFRFMKNMGQHYALKCGLDHCTGKYAITIDDDLQHPPEEIPKLIKAIESDPDIDVVLGRYEKKKHSAIRNFGTLAHSMITNAMFPNAKGLSMTSFRIMNRAVINQLNSMHHANPRIGLMILSITDSIANTDVEHHTRQIGRSNYTLHKMLKNTFDNLVNYSSIPLKLISSLGIIFACISIILACMYFIQYVVGVISLSGFTTLVILLLLVGGILMFSFGLVGEYLARIVSQQLIVNKYCVRTQLEITDAKSPPKQVDTT